jgi:hypothetical protein
MPLRVTVNTAAECLRTDCNILGDNTKNRAALSAYENTTQYSAHRRIRRRTQLDYPIVFANTCQLYMLTAFTTHLFCLFPALNV